MAIGNPWFTAVEQTLPEYVPLPMQQLFQAGQAVQNRYDTSIAAMDAAETGLASMQALAPAHRQYRDQLVSRYRTEASDLLDKYNSNAADPQFIREMRRLNTRYAADPNLQIISAANQSIAAKQKAIQDIQTKGGRYIDTNPIFTGIDAQGNLTYDAGSVRQTEFDTQIRQAFQDTQKAMINDGNIKTNKQALDRVMQSMISGAATNPVTRDALQYYMQQGYTPEQAQQQLANTLQQQYNSNLIAERDDTNERLALARANLAVSQGNLALARDKFAFEQTKEAAKQNRMGTLVTLSSPLDVKNINEALIKDVTAMINSGTGRSTPYVSVPDTPENRAKYPNAERVSGGSPGVGAASQNMLRLTNDQAKQNRQEFINSAREEISSMLPANASDTKVLEVYREYLKADNNAPTYITSPIKELRDNISSQYFGERGSNLGDAYIVDKNGKASRVADGGQELTDLKDINFTGITMSPVRDKSGRVEFTGGTMKGTAVNKKGDIITIYKPLPPQLQEATQLSNVVDRALTSGVTNKQLLEDSSLRVLGRNIVPQKRNGRISFFEVDNNNRIIGEEFDPAQVKQILDNEKSLVSQFFGMHQNTD